MHAYFSPTPVLALSPAYIPYFFPPYYSSIKTEEIRTIGIIGGHQRASHLGSEANQLARSQ